MVGANLDVGLLAPELILVVAASLVLLADALLPARARRVSLPLALLGLAAAAVASLTLVGRNTTSFFGTLVVDDYAVLFKLLFIGSAALVVLAAGAFLDRNPRVAGEFSGLLLFATAGLCLMAAGGELISIYVALELASIALYLLVGLARGEPRSSEAALKYMLLGALSSAVLLYGMALLYGLSGATHLAEIGRAVADGAPPALLLAMVLVAAGLGFKIAIVPSQMWAPDVYEGAPTPVTAFLATASKAAGFAVVVRIFTSTLGGVQAQWTLLFAVLAALTMTVGNLAALPQSNIKRMLAYSGIGHAGYLLMGLAAASATGLSSVLYYLVVYAATNLAAFTVVLLVARAVPGDRIAGYAGLHRRAPWLSLVLAISLLSLAGLPPMAGFFAKLYLFAAAFDAGLAWLVVLGLLNSALSLYYYAAVIRQMYLAAPEDESGVEPPASGPVRQPVGALVSLGVTAALVLALGIASDPLLGFARLAVAAVVR